VEFVPFKAAIEAGVATIMTAHVLVPALDADRPASLSSRIVTDLLKTTMKYDGVVLSDDLGMKAISATWPLGEASIAAIEAGCDAVLFCNSTIDEQVTALEAVIRAAESGRLSSTRLDDAFARQRRVKERFLARAPRPARALDVVGCAEHWAVAEEMAAFR
ncbi:MAG TPA: glycoside hydrolase family 3 N-terminal domain-containing protein, partial [Vicinamibacterales bacterium]|nr:glycoside hydrolase family 3 N-terminal domain-containing protein [Vicinamibacterales bacterium]